MCVLTWHVSSNVLTLNTLNSTGAPHFICSSACRLYAILIIRCAPLRVTVLRSGSRFEGMSLERALQAAQQGNFSFIESISRADLTQLLQKSDEDGRTLVHAAAAAGQTQLLSYLLSSGGEQCVNRCDDEVSLESSADKVYPAHIRLSSSLSVACGWKLTGLDTPALSCQRGAPRQCKTATGAWSRRGCSHVWRTHSSALCGTALMCPAAGWPSSKQMDRPRHD